MSLQSSVNLGPTWILITLKIQSNSSWLLKGLKVSLHIVVVSKNMFCNQLFVFGCCLDANFGAS